MHTGIQISRLADYVLLDEITATARKLTSASLVWCSDVDNIKICYTCLYASTTSFI